jgi:hypothetical protein
VLAIWALLGAVALEIVVTYWRIPPHELYHVHHHGIANGLSRAATFLNFPAAALAIATLPSAYERRPRVWTATVAAAALVLCCFTFAPGVVRQSNLDARPINAVAATGVLLGLVLSLGRPRPWSDSAATGPASRSSPCSCSWRSRGSEPTSGSRTAAFRCWGRSSRRTSSGRSRTSPGCTRPSTSAITTASTGC